MGFKHNKEPHCNIKACMAMHSVARLTITPLKNPSTLPAELAGVALEPPGEAALVRCLLRAGVPAGPVVMLCNDSSQSFAKTRRLSVGCQQSSVDSCNNALRGIITHGLPRVARPVSAAFSLQVVQHTCQPAIS